MISEDRELLHTLRRQQQDLQRSLARLDAQLGELEARTRHATLEELSLPPLPTDHLPPVPTHDEDLPPLPTDVAFQLPPLPRAKPPVRATKPSLEFQFGKWLTVLGSVLGLLTLALIFTLPSVDKFLGPFGLLGLSALISVMVFTSGERLERSRASFTFFGRIVSLTALAWLYLTAYAAGYYEPLQVIHHPLVAGFVLLLWSIYVLLLAERKKSQGLAVFAIFLAYISTAINSIGAFTMAADLLLAATSVFLFVRHGWTALPYVSLLFTYFAPLRHLVIDESGELVFDTSRTLPFWPHAVYLTAAWLTFTAAVILSKTPSFRGVTRFIFLSLNNGALAGLLALAASITGYDYGCVGQTFLASGVAFLLASRFAGWAEIEPEEAMAAYAAQGLALFTAGLTIVYTGTTRAVLLLTEALLLGGAAAFSADIILIVTTHVAALFAAVFLFWEIGIKAHHPWLFSMGGATVLLINAWWARAEFRNGPRSQSTIVLSTSYYCVLALGLIFTAINTELSDAAMPPALALFALGLTFLIYVVSIYELPPLAQLFLLGAQALVLFPADTGEPLPWWTTAVVAAVTLLTLTWWTRQRVTRQGTWVALLKLIYGLALVGMAYDALRPYADPQAWMIEAAILSAAFLAFGALMRVWPLALMGQLFLALSVYHFFVPPGGSSLHSFSWEWWAAAAPIVVLYASAHATQEWLRLFTNLSETKRMVLRAFAYSYQLLALVMFVRAMFALVPAPGQIAAFLALGTLFLEWNTNRANAFGVRCSLLLTFLGLGLYLHRFTNQAVDLASFLNAFALLLVLVQPALLRGAQKALVSRVESWALILLSVATTWLFVSAWAVMRINPHYLTMSWALYGLFLFVLGLFAWERRQRWCGLAIVLIAITRVFASDFWGFSSSYRVLTFVVLTLITLGLGFLYARFSDRLKTWL